MAEALRKLSCPADQRLSIALCHHKRVWRFKSPFSISMFSSNARLVKGGKARWHGFAEEFIGFLFLFLDCRLGAVPSCSTNFELVKH